MPRFVNMTRDHSDVNKESLNSTVHSAPVVTVVAIGAASSFAADLMRKEGAEGINFVYYNEPKLDEKFIESDLSNAHMVIVMGERDYSSLFECVVRVSKKINLLTIGIGIAGIRYFYSGFNRYDPFVLVSSEKLLFIQQSITDFLNLACAGLARVLLVEGRQSVDFRDIEKILSQPGQAAIGVGTGTGVNRARDAVNAALAHPNLNGIDFRRAGGALLILKSSSTISVSEHRMALNCFPNSFGEFFTRFLSSKAMFMGLLVEGGTFGDEMRATIIVTGLNSIKGDDVNHIIWKAIETRNNDLICQIMFGGIDLEMQNRSRQKLEEVLEQSNYWHGQLIHVQGHRQDDHKSLIPKLFYRQLALSKLVNDDLLYEALLRRGFLVFRDAEGVWLGTGSHTDDLLILERLYCLTVTRVSNSEDRLAHIAFRCRHYQQLKAVDQILSIPQNIGMMGGRAYLPYRKGHTWLSYRNTAWGTKLSVCPSTHLKHRHLGYDALDTGIALLVKAWPLARVSTAFSCDGHGEHYCHLGFLTEWDFVWAESVFTAIAMETPGSRWFGPNHKIETINGKDDDDSILAFMDDIQCFARKLMLSSNIDKIGRARSATLEVFGNKAPKIEDFAAVAKEQLALVGLDRD
jgi:cell division GTPase FtsZ